ncbi:MAG: hypothetical protein LBK96_02705 [Prevotellaceae bacterium]|jgi:hypothetical protein|nr:hypothetical protein [Prevotellaceae bacterium]
MNSLILYSFGWGYGTTWGTWGIPIEKQRAKGLWIEKNSEKMKKISQEIKKISQEIEIICRFFKTIS